MKTRGLVLDPRKYRGTVTPPGTLEDTSRFSNDGVHTDITWVRLPSGLWVMSCNGATSVVTIADSDSLDITEQITMEVWASPTVLLDGAAFIDKWWDGINRTYAYYIQDIGGGIMRVRVILAGPGGLDDISLDSATLQVDVWQHIVATWNHVTVYIYINGIQENSIAKATSIARNTANLLIGMDWGARYLTGLISQPRVYNYALSPADIYAHYQAERSLFGV